jgi:hypothetical protein
MLGTTGTSGKLNCYHLFMHGRKVQIHWLVTNI